MSDSIVSDMQDSFGYSGDEGFTQQSFLGASIRSFQTSAGFGGTTSTLSVDLVNDEYHTSDGLALGLGVDLYHDGIQDKFNPPNVGSPVYFKMGLNPLTVSDGWSNTYNDIYGAHFSHQSSFAFGGILQSIDQTKDEGGNPLFSVSVSDPRELLSNCVLILNNYAGTTYNNKNLFNVYGFLEYDPSDTLQADLDSESDSKDVLTRLPGGVLQGNDTYTFEAGTFSPTNKPTELPITGRGFSRRTEQGIPWYRVEQAMKALLNYDGALPDEYVDAGFGGAVDFRGFKYVIDFSGLPLDLIPKMYFIDYDQVDLFSLLQELCETISHQMLVSLLPVLDHPSTSWLWDYNGHQTANSTPENVIAGIIRIDTIDKSSPPDYGAVQNYLNNLTASGVEISSENLGYELSNVTTDKFIAGAQEVGMYAFTNNKDRDHLELRKFKHNWRNYLDHKMSKQWDLDVALKQQILPFYGFLGKGSVTIPKGWGPYQQIMLDSSSLKAFGVGAYYVATEIELRYASMSYSQWLNFLRRMNEEWMRKAESGWAMGGGVKTPVGFIDNNDEYAVSVPRCVFNSDKPALTDAGLPESACSPPYGYPLYYKRLEHIGLSIGTHKAINLDQTAKIVLTKWKHLVTANTGGRLRKGTRITPTQEKMLRKYHVWSNDMDCLVSNVDAAIDRASSSMKDVQSYRERAEYNTRKVYDFVKGVADKHLGKTFLVKIPKHANLEFYDKTTIEPNTHEIFSGPYGFKPDENGKTAPLSFEDSAYTKFLDDNIIQYDDGALKANYNPISELWEFNYLPEPQGGYFSEEIHKQVSKEMLAPKDPTNFSENGRWSCYVRFNHSQTLDLSAVGSENISQEKISVDGSIPDILEELDNVRSSQMVSASDLEGFQKGEGDKYSAFVKCTVDPQLYMTPKVITSGVQVHSRGARLIPNYGDIKTKGSTVSYAPEKILAPFTGRNYIKELVQFQRVSGVIDTAYENLDSDHVYAVITIPARIMPIEAYRFVNINKTASNGLDYITNEIYNRGVIFGVPEFNSPPPMKESLPVEEALKIKAIRKASGPELSVNLASPSPVYPDLVVLPLVSTERCYGPWLSSTHIDNGVLPRNRYSDIGGKIEFNKNEQLAPWNYAGYELMNEAGALSAAFSNSLLMFAEKGSFTVPGLPLNISLGAALLSNGPLVTSINVNVDSDVKTTVQMDMFSSAFGKLQENKEESLAKLGRDRQKILDIANKMARGASQRNASDNHAFSRAVENIHKSSMQTGNTVYDVFVSTAVRREEKRVKLEGDDVDGNGDLVGQEFTDVDYYNSAALQSRGYLDETLTVNSDANANRAMLKNSAGGHLSHMFSPYDELPYNRNMPSVPYVHTAAIQQRTN